MQERHGVNAEWMRDNIFLKVMFGRRDEGLHVVFEYEDLDDFLQFVERLISRLGGWVEEAEGPI
jgi:hypothetical protein